MAERALEAVARLLELNARALVNSPESIEVTYAQTEEAVTFTLKTISREVGQLVGRNGRLGNALRTVVKSATRKDIKLPVYLSIEAL